MKLVVLDTPYLLAFIGTPTTNRGASNLFEGNHMVK